MVQVKNMKQRSYIMLYFENDYCEGAHEAILKRLMETNMEKVPGYGQDPFCDKAKEKIKEAKAYLDEQEQVDFMNHTQIRKDLNQLLKKGSYQVILYKTKSKSL